MHIDMHGRFSCTIRNMVTIGASWHEVRAARAARMRAARTPVVITLIRWLARVLPSWPRVRTTVMQVAAFGFIDVSVWRWWSPLAGGIAVGVSLLILEALGDGPKRGGR